MRRTRYGTADRQCHPEGREARQPDRSESGGHRLRPQPASHQATEPARARDSETGTEHHLRNMPLSVTAPQPPHRGRPGPLHRIPHGRSAGLCCTQKAGENSMVPAPSAGHGHPRRAGAVVLLRQLLRILLRYLLRILLRQLLHLTSARPTHLCRSGCLFRVVCRSDIPLGTPSPPPRPPKKRGRAGPWRAAAQGDRAREGSCGASAKPPRAGWGGRLRGRLEGRQGASWTYTDCFGLSLRASTTAGALVSAVPVRVRPVTWAGPAGARGWR